MNGILRYCGYWTRVGDRNAFRNVYPECNLRPDINRKLRTVMSHLPEVQHMITDRHAYEDGLRVDHSACLLMPSKPSTNTPIKRGIVRIKVCGWR